MAFHGVEPPWKRTNVSWEDNIQHAADIAQFSIMQQQLSVMVLTFDQLQMFTDIQRWQQGPQPPNWPSMDVVQSQVQWCVESLWLQLGPALLSLC